MPVFFWIAFGVMALYAAVYLVYIVSIAASQAGAAGQAPSQLPRISILIAARNEEKNIGECLAAIARLQYPQEKMEVLIGDDHSEDSTAAIVAGVIKDHSWMHLHRITTELPGIRGKQNVLAQLAHHAKGEILLVTDADIVVPPTWAASLAEVVQASGGMASGSTLVNGKGLFARLQSLDWMMGIGAAAAHARLGIPITAVGNNMAFTAEAYRATGGYENIPFSITEDYKLFQVIVEKGRAPYHHLLDGRSLNESKPIEGVRGWLHQRRRWFRGGSEIPWYNAAFLLFNGSVMPLMLLALFFIPFFHWAALIGVKCLMDFLFLCITSARLGKARWMIAFPLYEVYYQLSAIVTPINFLVPVRVIWKGRKY